MNRIFHFCTQRRWSALALWLVLTAALVAVAQAMPGPTSNQYSIPDSPSSQAARLLDEHGLAADEAVAGQVVVESPDGLTRHADSLRTFVDQVRAQHPGWDVRTGDKATGLSEISDDGRIGLLDVEIASGPVPYAEKKAAATSLQSLAPKSDGLTVAYTGDIFPSPSGGPSEGVGLLAAVVVILVAFGSVLAMAVPILVALVGAVSGVMGLSLAAHLVEMSSAATPLAAMLAVGVGIDYSLLIVTRYREALTGGADVRQAVHHAMDTAGRSVLFAGVTVILAVLGLLTMQMPLISGVAVGAALAITITMAASLTLLPALLALIGRHIDRFSLPGRARGRVDDRAGGTAFARWARVVQRRPWAWALTSLVLLAVLTVPAFSLRLGFDNAGAQPTSTTQRQAYDLMARGFGPGVHAPLFVSVDTTGATDADASLSRVKSELAQTPGVASVDGPHRSDDGKAAVAIVLPTSAPESEETTEVVHRIRDQAPTLQSETGLRIGVAGSTAALIDYSEYIQAKLPVFVGVVLTAAFVLLMVVFRSILVPLKAVAMNLLSIGASFGVVVAVVQWGWLGSALGFQHPMPVTAWVPMMLIAVVFGLSMDYEVFLLGRMQEYYRGGHDNSSAVAHGLAHTGQVITAAAAIMICVFGGFVLGPAVDLKVFGLGLAVAVLLDATVVRMILVPALMELMGDANWWWPGSGRRRRFPAQVQAEVSHV